ncbi:hypothetical protein Barb6_00896 [Bacteroidales bacterium Barb6]|nr:hypothetical protein Barb4_02172 [Bacteroidales bacterium Barb4]OAV72698.1 hypothetical protein Barb6_00896 [Bacteroidales bacterium Barb6]OAV74077.1 hypothetical protein Barb7_02472 [Bacteroidales bacterium Barb7]
MFQGVTDQFQLLLKSARPVVMSEGNTDMFFSSFVSSVSPFCQTPASSR